MSASDAQSVMKKNAFGYLSKLKQRLQSDGTYRSWVVWRASLRIVGRNFGRATLELAAAFYTQHKRRQGKQIVSTRKKAWARDKDMRGLFCGMDAYRRHVGRPALSEAQWLWNYRQRLKRRKKTKRRRSGGSGVTVPQTRHPRPERTLNPRARAGTVQEDTGGGRATGPFGRAGELTDKQRDEFMRRAWDDAVSLAGDFGQEIKTHAGYWIDV